MHSSRVASGVYFVVNADGRFVKIGFSEHILERFLQVRTIGPGTADARLIGYIPGAKSTEEWLHGAFQKHRDVGEWFHYTPEYGTSPAGTSFLCRTSAGRLQSSKAR